jgi:hypothetical protein
MRKALACGFAVLAALVLQTPARADAVAVRFTDEAGVVRIARIGDVSVLTGMCGQRVAGSGGTIVLLDLADGSHATVLRNGADLLVPAASGGGWCSGSRELRDAIATAHAAESSRGPWLALVLAFGGLGLGIFVLVLWGAGRGPAPTLGPPAPDPHEHDHAAH